MRKPAALFVAAFATVAGGGLAVAVEGAPVSSSEDLPADPTATDMQLVEELQAAEVEEAPAENHGTAVSEAAHDCPQENHGQCVSEVARDNHGDRDDEQRGNGNGNGHGNSNGRGHEQGNGNGHDRDD